MLETVREFAEGGGPGAGASGQPCGQAQRQPESSAKADVLRLLCAEQRPCRQPPQPAAGALDGEQSAQEAVDLQTRHEFHAHASLGFSVVSAGVPGARRD